MKNSINIKKVLFAALMSVCFVAPGMAMKKRIKKINKNIKKINNEIGIQELFLLMLEDTDKNEANEIKKKIENFRKKIKNLNNKKNPNETITFKFMVDTGLELIKKMNVEEVTLIKEQKKLKNLIPLALDDKKEIIEKLVSHYSKFIDIYRHLLNSAKSDKDTKCFKVNLNENAIQVNLDKKIELYIKSLKSYISILEESMEEQTYTMRTSYGLIVNKVLDEKVHSSDEKKLKDVTDKLFKINEEHLQSLLKKINDEVENLKTIEQEKDIEGKKLGYFIKIIEVYETRMKSKDLGDKKRREYQVKVNNAKENGKNLKYGFASLFNWD